MSSPAVPDLGHRTTLHLSHPTSSVAEVVEVAVAHLQDVMGARVKPVGLTWGEGTGPFRSLELTLVEWWPGIAVQHLVWEVRGAQMADRQGVGRVRVSLRGPAPPAIGVTADMVAEEIEGRLRPGATNELVCTVTGPFTTDHVDGVPPVLATPRMLELMERVSQALVLPHLASGHTTVGARLDVAHRRPAFLGEAVTVRSVLVGMDRRRLTFAVSAAVGDRLVGEGSHQGHIVAYGGIGRTPSELGRHEISPRAKAPGPPP